MSGAVVFAIPGFLARRIPAEGVRIGPLRLLPDGVLERMADDKLMLRLIRAWSEALRAIDLRVWREAKLRAEAAIEIEDMMAGDLPTQSPSVAAARLFGDDVVQQRCRDRQ